MTQAAVLQSQKKKVELQQLHGHRSPPERSSTNVRHLCRRRGGLGLNSSLYNKICLSGNKCAWPVNFGFCSLPANTHTRSQIKCLFPALLSLLGRAVQVGCCGAAQRPRITRGDGRRPAGLFRWERAFVWHNNMSSMPQYRCFDRGHCWNAAPLFASHGEGGREGWTDGKAGIHG